MPNATFHLRFAVACFVLCLPWVAVAQAPAGAARYPSETVRLIVPFTAAAATDRVSRLIADKLRETAGQQVVVENKPGANGIIAVQTLLAAAPNGHTLLISSNTPAAGNAALYRKLPYDPLRDLMPVARLFRTATVLVTAGDAPYRSVADLVTASQRGKTLTFGSAAAGYTLVYENFRRQSGIDSQVVPYRGTGPALQDVIGKTIDLAFGDPVAVRALVQSGRLRALAVTSDRRDPMFPDVPTTEEVGGGRAPLFQWIGVFAPQGTPPTVLARIADLIRTATADPRVVEAAQAAGLLSFPGSAEDLRRQQEAEIEGYRTLMKLVGMEPE